MPSVASHSVSPRRFNGEHRTLQRCPFQNCKCETHLVFSTFRQPCFGEQTDSVKFISVKQCCSIWLYQNHIKSINWGLSGLLERYFDKQGFQKSVPTAGWRKKKVKKKKRCNSGGGTGASKGNIGLRMIKKSREEKKENLKEISILKTNKQNFNFTSLWVCIWGVRWHWGAPNFPTGLNSLFHRLFFSPRTQTTTPSLSLPLSSKLQWN